MDKGHYIRLLDNLKPFAEKVQPMNSDWQQIVFNDITENGKKLTIVNIKDSDDRPAIALSGDIFYCEAGKDSYRDDVLVVFRLFSANLRLPDKMPDYYEASFTMIGQSERPINRLDSISDFFPLEESILQSPHLTPILSIGKVGIELGAFLSNMSEKLRRKWLPGIDCSEKVSVEETIALLCDIWRQFRLERLTNTNLRQRTILNGILKIQEFGDDFDGLLKLININMLNAFTNRIEHSDATQNSNLIKLIERMTKLPLTEKMRSRIWTAMAKQLDRISIRKEVKEIASVFNKISQIDAHYWAEACISASKSVALLSKDTLLLDTVELLETATDSVSAVVKWTNTIHFEESRPIKECKERPILIDHSPIATQEDDMSILTDLSPVLDLETKIDLTNYTESDVESQKQMLEQWVVRLRMQNFPDYTEAILSDLVGTSKIIHGIVKGSSFSIQSLEVILYQIGKLQELLHDKLNQLPDPSSLREDFKLAQDIFKKAFNSVGDDIYILMKNDIPIKDVESISELLAQKKNIAVLPDWLWKQQRFHENNLALALSNPIIRHRISNFFNTIDTLDPNLFEALKKISSPGKNQDIDEFIKEDLSRYIKLIKKFDKLDNIDHDWYLNELQSGVPEHKITDYMARINNLQVSLSKDKIDQVFAYIRSGNSYDNRERTLYMVEKALDFFEKTFGNTESATFNLIENWININKDSIDENRNQQKTLSPSFSLEHNFVDYPRRRLHLTYHPYHNSMVGDYGYFSAPILLQSKIRPTDLDIHLNYDVVSTGTKAWPSEWEGCKPNAIRIQSDKWRRANDIFIYSFKITVPTRCPKSSRENVKLTLKAEDQNSSKPIDINGSIVWEHWDKIEENVPDVKIDWPDGIQTKYVIEHPIGPQEHLNYIEDRLKGGSSFAIVSPRRFGKTTLAMYLCEIGEKWGLVVPPYVLCTDTTIREATGGINIPRVWKNFSDNLTEMLGASLKLGDEDIPGIDAFDYVRRAAKKQGKKGILLILDEAQLFFSKSFGHRLGTALKDRLEQEWSRPNYPDMVPIYFGFIGLPDILEKMGANLQGLLMPKDTQTITHSRLNQLLYTFTGHSLHTTQEARDKLSHISGNLYMLKTLLAEIVKHVNDEKRNWVHYDDVVVIVEELKTDLGSGYRSEIAHYLRDVFNESDDVNFWKPRPCYPLAVALAKVMHEEGGNVQRLLPHVRQTLTTWCMSAGYDSSKRLEYTDHRINEHLQILEELGVLKSPNGFTNDILAAWLLGQAWNFPNNLKDREALFAGALKTILIPEGRELVNEGSQAKIFKFSENQETYALRTINLETHEKQRRFHETIEILGAIKENSFKNKEGAEYIYRLHDIGIADIPIEETSEGLMGVEIYHWIDGNSLEEKIGRLNKPFVASIGVKLAKAMKLIHDYNILHRDICPRNIILSANTTYPILIDFGLARFGTQEMTTLISSSYTAPEITGTKPKWSKASDIYSLGKTLQSLLVEKELTNSPFEDLLTLCISEKASDRPSASQLLAELENLIQDLRVEDLRKNASKKLNAIVEVDIKQYNWFKDLIRDKIDLIFQSVFLGLHDDIFGKCMESAQILDFTLEAYPSKEEPLKLTYVYNRKSKYIGSSLKNQKCIEFLGKLRNARNHKDLKLSKQQILRKFGNPTDIQMESWAREGAKLIEESMQLNSLSAIVDELLSS